MLRRRQNAGAELRTKDPTMTSEYNRRTTDRGYISQFPTTLSVLRRALGLVPVSETLGSLSHWRRRRDAAQTETAGQ
jgi:hypothetical protein